MSEAFSALWASIVRTVVPIIVGSVLGWFTSANIPLDAEFEGTLTALLTLLFTAAYYVAVRLFETYISPKIGWLLGYAKSPDSYSAEQAGKHRAVATSPEVLDVGNWSVSHTVDGRVIDNRPEGLT